MPQLVPDIWVWWRTYLSARGPENVMRLVLDGHMRCMRRDGRGCWAGVRHIAELTGLNKDTVAKYRGAALQTGWLTAAPPEQAERPGEVWASVPDGIPLDGRAPRGRTPERAVRPDPTPASATVRREPVQNPSPVRNEPPVCPTRSDISSEISHLSLKTQRSPEVTARAVDNAENAGQEKPSSEEIARGSANLRRLKLFTWLSAVEARPHRGDYAALVRVVPDRLRCDGYEQVVQEFLNQASSPPSEGNPRGDAGAEGKDGESRDGQR